MSKFLNDPLQRYAENLIDAEGVILGESEEHECSFWRVYQCGKIFYACSMTQPNLEISAILEISEEEIPEFI